MDKRTSKDELAKRTRHLERVNLDSSGRPRNDPDTDAALKDLQTVRRHIAGSGESLVLARFRILVYGPPAASRAERASSTRVLNQRCDQITAALHAIDGIDAAREEPAALLALYSSALLGEATADKTGREMMEVAHSMAALIPTETAWRGSARPHTLLSTASGRLTALNLWDKSTRSNIKSPLVLITGEPGSGKSVLGGRIINDALATQKGLRVQAVDVGGSLAPHAGVVGARYLRLHPDDPRTINIWDYPELEDGELPSEEQIALVVMDALTLRGDKDTSGIASDLLAKAVKEVYKNFAPRNGPGLPKVEPIHSFLVEMLENYDFGHPHLDSEARQLALKLEKYVGNPWVDQPTHPNFNLPSPYDVYELDSLEAFTPDLRMTLSNRIAARVVRAIGWKQADGTRSPLLAVFDEVHKYTDKYPNILEVIDKGARQGRKENAVTMLITQTYDDVRSIRGIRATAGVKIVGRQTGDFSSLVADAGLSDRAVSAIHAIKNLDGIHAQFVLALGSGRDQVVEMIQVDLSPAELWTFTSNPDERNARARVHALRPEWSPAEAIAWLAAQYPRGLAAAGLIEIDERLLARS